MSSKNVLISPILEILDHFDNHINVKKGGPCGDIHREVGKSIFIENLLYIDQCLKDQESRSTQLLQELQGTAAEILEGVGVDSPLGPEK